MNTLVSFPIAKLLKEKGFDKLTECLWLFIGSYREKIPNRNSENLGYSAPTIAEVVMWLYEKHGIWIANNWQPGSKTFLYELIDVNSYENTILIQEKNYKDVGEVKFNSPTEAYEAAILYTLNNLI